jgi:hypothetical protein
LVLESSKKDKLLIDLPSVLLYALGLDWVCGLVVHCHLLTFLSAVHTEDGSTVSHVADVTGFF